MAQYLILLCEDENGYAQATEADMGRIFAEHEAFQKKYGDKVAGGNALQPTTTATSIRADGAGGFSVTDGPFVETKEAIGGYYLVEAADLDEAIAIGKDVPAPFGGVEVRPIMVFS